MLSGDVDCDLWNGAWWRLPHGLRAACCAAALLAPSWSRRGETNPFWRLGTLPPVTYMPIDVLSALWTVVPQEILLICKNSCQTKCHRRVMCLARGVEGTSSSQREAKAEVPELSLKRPSAGKEFVRGGWLEASSGQRLTLIFWCSGEWRGNTFVQSQLEMPNKSLLGLQCWIAPWEHAVQMLYWIFKEQFFTEAEIWERTECSKSLKMNRATALQVREWQERFI